MGRPKGARNKPKPQQELLPLLNLEIPVALYDWLGEMPGFHALVILQTPNGKAFSVELYTVPVSDTDNVFGSGQDPILRTAFTKAIASYNQQAEEKGRKFIV